MEGIVHGGSDRVNGYYQERNDQHRLSVDDSGSIDSEFSGVDRDG
ncbi:MAG: hypothetical protein ACJ8CR_23970 [Roseiflexaceae bacterium]